MGESTSIRPATNADRGAVTNLIFSILNDYGLTGDPEGTDSDLDDIEANYFENGGSFDVVVDDSGTIVGTVGLMAIDDASVELRKMYLDKSVRGRGLGRNLLAHALTRAAALGFQRIELETNSRLVEAIALYERNGFTRIGGELHAARCDQRYERML